MDVRQFAAVAVAALLHGCATGPEKTEADFGKSVRQMIAVQRLDGTPGAKPGSLDGRQAERVLQAYRGDVARPQDVKAGVNMPMAK